MDARYRVGIDVGGTFTDVYWLDEVSGAAHTHKISSTPDDPHRAPIEALRQSMERIGARGEQVAFVGLGTTVATNALLEGKGARTGLITTKGFRDLLEIGRQTRPHLYDPFVQKAKLLVPRELRCEVPERLAADGGVIIDLDEGALRDAITCLRHQGVESVAICFLNSYVDPKHEIQALEVLRRCCPEVHAVTSSQVMPEFREYERLVSTVVNAYLMPSMRDYFQAFERAVAALGIPVAPLVMSSSGGVFTPELAAARPIDTLFSGPSGGVSSAVFVAGAAGHRNIITFDMGGTSTEVCLVRDGQPQLSHSRTVKGYPIRTTAHDIHTIGAGGSSIGTVDPGGMLQVGPESAGADPGPACYASGGAYATVTDANVVLGRLNPQSLLGGALKIDAGKSFEAIQHAVAEPKGCDVPSAASAMLELAEANMAQALRVVSVERGIDPGGYVLVALGGAGPLHAAAIARQIGMAGVLVPPHPGVLCAMGVLAKDVQLNFSRTKLIDSGQSDACRVADAAYADLERAAGDELVRQHGQTNLRMARSAAVRYRGQNHEISVSVPEGEFDAQALLQTAERFHHAHKELYGYCFDGHAIELVTLRLAAVVAVERPRLEKTAASAEAKAATPVGQRMALFDDGETHACPVFARAALDAGQHITGPAIIEQMDTTTVLPPGFAATVDPWLNLFVTWPSRDEP